MARDVVVQKQLWGVEDVSDERSRTLLRETEAAVRLLGTSGGTLDFSGLDTVAVSDVNCSTFFFRL